MTVPTRVSTLTDGNVLTAEELNKNTFQQGRKVGFDGGSAGGGEVLNGQITKANFTTSGQWIGPQHVQRGTFGQKGQPSAFRQSRDWARSRFPTMAGIKASESESFSRTVLARNYRIQGSASRICIDWAVCWTMSDLVGGQIPEDLQDAVVDANGRPFAGAMTFWVDGIPLRGLWTPMQSGRSSTVASGTSPVRYYNNLSYPDLRSMGGRLWLKTAYNGEDSALTSALFTEGWHTFEIRVILRATTRFHGGHVYAKPWR